MSVFYRCEKCGKKLIQRLPNGIWVFRFGRQEDDNGKSFTPVEMYIYGSIQMKCIKRTCGHLNNLHYFPNQQAEESPDTISMKED